MYSLIIDESEGVVWAALMHEFATMGQQLARDRMCTGQHSTQTDLSQFGFLPAALCSCRNHICVYVLAYLLREYIYTCFVCVTPPICTFSYIYG